MLLKDLFPRFALLHFFSFLTAFLDVVGIGLVFPLVVLILDPTSDFASLPAVVQNLFRTMNIEEVTISAVALVLMVVFLIKNLLKYAVLYGNSRLVNSIRGLWMRRLYKKYISSHYSFFITNKHGELIYNLTDLTQRAMYGVRQTVDITMHGLIVLSSLVILFAISWEITTVVLVCTLALWGMVQKPITKRVSRLGKKVLHFYHETSNLATESFKGVREVKIYSLQKELSSLFSNYTTQMVNASTKINLFENIPNVLPEVLVMTVLGISLIVLEQREQNLALIVPFIATYTYAGMRMMVSGSSFSRAIISFFAHWPSIDRLARDLSERSYNDVVGGDILVIEKADSLTLKSVSYKYPGSAESALLNVDMNFKRGKITTIVGGSGSGKSTITNLIARLLEPNAGQILYGNADLGTFGLTSWREQLGFVGQSAFLFNSTVKDNLTLGSNEKYTTDEINKALKKAAAYNFVQEKPRGLETFVGEGGDVFSGGQRQRIAIARALLKNSPVLVFDEATSALDPATEKKFLRTLQEIKHDKIIIFITHRMAAIELSDFVYVMNAGSVVEKGIYSELVSGKQHLYKLLNE